jgi:serine/threonine-protein kinase RsbW
MSESVVRLTFPAKADYLLLARLALSGVVRHLRLEEEQLADLKLAVTEACGNAVRHAYEGEAGPVGLAFVVADDRLTMIVEDQGEGMDAAAVAAADDPPAAAAPLESGMGMAIIRTIVDELDIEPGADGRGTVVRMTKYLPGAAEAPV